jgi:hypothetical protein
VSEPFTQIAGHSTAAELTRRTSLVDLLDDCPIPRDERAENLSLFLNRQAFGRLLFFADLYQRFLPVHGVIMEFGVRWGRDLALFQALRGLLEPYNYTRRIIGFDTFEGFVSIDEADGAEDYIAEGAYNVTEGYEHYLEQVLRMQEQGSPIEHIQKFELRKGDASVELPRYLEEHPETVVAFAYFDMDVYPPTRDCLEALKPHLVRGSVLGFDELNSPDFPGETVALREVFGLNGLRLERSTLGSYPSFVVLD